MYNFLFNINTISIILIVAFLLLVAIIVQELVIKHRDYKLMKDHYNLESLRLRLETPLDLTAVELLDGLVMECHKEYVVFNIEYRRGVINSELEHDIARKVTQLVGDRISPTLVDKLGCIYNKYELSDIIAKKVYAYNMNYVIQNNHQ